MDKKFDWLELNDNPENKKLFNKNRSVYVLRAHEQRKKVFFHLLHIEKLNIDKDKLQLVRVDTDDEKIKQGIKNIGILKSEKKSDAQENTLEDFYFKILSLYDLYFMNQEINKRLKKINMENRIRFFLYVEDNQEKMKEIIERDNQNIRFKKTTIFSSSYYSTVAVSEWGDNQLGYTFIINVTQLAKSNILDSFDDRQKKGLSFIDIKSDEKYELLIKIMYIVEQQIIYFMLLLWNQMDYKAISSYNKPGGDLCNILYKNIFGEPLDTFKIFADLRHFSKYRNMLLYCDKFSTMSPASLLYKESDEKVSLKTIIDLPFMKTINTHISSLLTVLIMSSEYWTDIINSTDVLNSNYPDEDYNWNNYVEYYNTIAQQKAITADYPISLCDNFDKDDNIFKKYNKKLAASKKTYSLTATLLDYGYESIKKGLTGLTKSLKPLMYSELFMMLFTNISTKAIDGETGKQVNELMHTFDDDNFMNSVFLFVTPAIIGGLSSMSVMKKLDGSDIIKDFLNNMQSLTKKNTNDKSVATAYIIDKAKQAKLGSVGDLTQFLAGTSTTILLLSNYDYILSCIDNTTLAILFSLLYGQVVASSYLVGSGAIKHINTKIDNNQNTNKDDIVKNILKERKQSSVKKIDEIVKFLKTNKNEQDLFLSKTKINSIGNFVGHATIEKLKEQLKLNTNKDIYNFFDKSENINRRETHETNKNIFDNAEKIKKDKINTIVDNTFETIDNIKKTNIFVNLQKYTTSLNIVIGGWSAIYSYIYILSSLIMKNPKKTDTATKNINTVTKNTENINTVTKNISEEKSLFNSDTSNDFGNIIENFNTDDVKLLISNMSGVSQKMFTNFINTMPKIKSDFDDIVSFLNNNSSSLNTEQFDTLYSMINQLHNNFRDLDISNPVSFLTSVENMMVGTMSSITDESAIFALKADISSIEELKKYISDNTFSNIKSLPTDLNLQPKANVDINAFRNFDDNTSRNANDNYFMNFIPENLIYVYFTSCTVVGVGYNIYTAFQKYKKSEYFTKKEQALVELAKKNSKGSALLKSIPLHTTHPLSTFLIGTGITAGFEVLLYANAIENHQGYFMEELYGEAVAVAAGSTGMYRGMVDVYTDKILEKVNEEEKKNNITTYISEFKKEYLRLASVMRDIDESKSKQFLNDFDDMINTIDKSVETTTGLTIKKNYNIVKNDVYEEQSNDYKIKILTERITQLLYNCVSSIKFNITSKRFHVANFYSLLVSMFPNLLLTIPVVSAENKSITYKSVPYLTFDQINIIEKKRSVNENVIDKDQYITKYFNFEDEETEILGVDIKGYGEDKEHKPYISELYQNKVLVFCSEYTDGGGKKDLKKFKQYIYIQTTAGVIKFKCIAVIHNKIMAKDKSERESRRNGDPLISNITKNVKRANEFVSDLKKAFFVSNQNSPDSEIIYQEYVTYFNLFYANVGENSQWFSVTKNGYSSVKTSDSGIMDSIFPDGSSNLNSSYPVMYFYVNTTKRDTLDMAKVIYRLPAEHKELTIVDYGSYTREEISPDSKLLQYLIYSKFMAQMEQTSLEISQYSLILFRALYNEFENIEKPVVKKPTNETKNKDDEKNKKKDEDKTENKKFRKERFINIFKFITKLKIYHDNFSECKNYFYQTYNKNFLYSDPIQQQNDTDEKFDLLLNTSAIYKNFFGISDKNKSEEDKNDKTNTFDKTQNNTEEVAEKMINELATKLNDRSEAREKFTNFETFITTSEIKPFFITTGSTSISGQKILAMVKNADIVKYDIHIDEIMNLTAKDKSGFDSKFIASNRFMSSIAELKKLYELVKTINIYNPAAFSKKLENAEMAKLIKRHLSTIGIDFDRYYLPINYSTKFFESSTKYKIDQSFLQKTLSNKLIEGSSVFLLQENSIDKDTKKNISEYEENDFNIFFKVFFESIYVYSSIYQKINRHGNWYMSWDRVSDSAKLVDIYDENKISGITAKQIHNIISLKLDNTTLIKFFDNIFDCQARKLFNNILSIPFISEDNDLSNIPKFSYDKIAFKDSLNKFSEIKEPKKDNEGKKSKDDDKNKKTAYISFKIQKLADDTYEITTSAVDNKKKLDTYQKEDLKNYVQMEIKDIKIKNIDKMYSYPSIKDLFYFEKTQVDEEFLLTQKEKDKRPVDCYFVESDASIEHTIKTIHDDHVESVALLDNVKKHIFENTDFYEAFLVSLKIFHCLISVIKKYQNIFNINDNDNDSLISKLITAVLEGKTDNPYKSIVNFMAENKEAVSDYVFNSIFTGKKPIFTDMFLTMHVYEKIFSPIYKKVYKKYVDEKVNDLVNNIQNIGTDKDNLSGIIYNTCLTAIKILYSSEDNYSIFINEENFYNYAKYKTDNDNYKIKTIADVCAITKVEKTPKKIDKKDKQNLYNIHYILLQNYVFENYINVIFEETEIKKKKSKKDKKDKDEKETTTKKLEVKKYLNEDKVFNLSFDFVRERSDNIVNMFHEEFKKFEKNVLDNRGLNILLQYYYIYAKNKSIYGKTVYAGEKKIIYVNLENELEDKKKGEDNIYKKQMKRYRYDKDLVDFTKSLTDINFWTEQHKNFYSESLEKSLYYNDETLFSLIAPFVVNDIHIYEHYSEASTSDKTKIAKTTIPVFVANKTEDTDVIKIDVTNQDNKDTIFIVIDLLARVKLNELFDNPSEVFVSQLRELYKHVFEYAKKYIQQKNIFSIEQTEVLKFIFSNQELLFCVFNNVNIYDYKDSYIYFGLKRTIDEAKITKYFTEKERTPTLFYMFMSFLMFVEKIYEYIITFMSSSSIGIEKIIEELKKSNESKIFIDGASNTSLYLLSNNNVNLFSFDIIPSHDISVKNSEKIISLFEITNKDKVINFISTNSPVVKYNDIADLTIKNIASKRILQCLENQQQKFIKITEKPNFEHNTIVNNVSLFIPAKYLLNVIENLNYEESKLGVISTDFELKFFFCDNKNIDNYTDQYSLVVYYFFRNPFVSHFINNIPENNEENIYNNFLYDVNNICINIKSANNTAITEIKTSRDDLLTQIKKSRISDLEIKTAEIKLNHFKTFETFYNCFDHDINSSATVDNKNDYIKYAKYLSLMLKLKENYVTFHNKKRQLILSDINITRFSKIVGKNLEFSDQVKINSDFVAVYNSKKIEGPLIDIYNLLKHNGRVKKDNEEYFLTGILFKHKYNEESIYSFEEVEERLSDWNKKRVLVLYDSVEYLPYNKSSLHWFVVNNNKNYKNNDYINYEFNKKILLDENILNTFGDLIPEIFFFTKSINDIFISNTYMSIKNYVDDAKNKFLSIDNKFTKYNIHKQLSDQNILFLSNDEKIDFLEFSVIENISTINKFRKLPDGDVNNIVKLFYSEKFTNYKNHFQSIEFDNTESETIVNPQNINDCIKMSNRPVINFNNFYKSTFPYIYDAYNNNTDLNIAKKYYDVKNIMLTVLSYIYNDVNTIYELYEYYESSFRDIASKHFIKQISTVLFSIFKKYISIPVNINKLNDYIGNVSNTDTIDIISKYIYNNNYSKCIFENMIPFITTVKFLVYEYEIKKFYTGENIKYNITNIINRIYSIINNNYNNNIFNDIENYYINTSYNLLKNTNNLEIEIKKNTITIDVAVLNKCLRSVDINKFLYNILLTDDCLIMHNSKIFDKSKHSNQNQFQNIVKMLLCFISEYFENNSKYKKFDILKFDTEKHYKLFFSCFNISEHFVSEKDLLLTLDRYKLTKDFENIFGSDYTTLLKSENFSFDIMLGMILNNDDYVKSTNYLEYMHKLLEKKKYNYEAMYIYLLLKTDVFITFDIDKFICGLCGIDNISFIYDFIKPLANKPILYSYYNTYSNILLCYEFWLNGDEKIVEDLNSIISECCNNDVKEPEIVKFFAEYHKIINMYLLSKCKYDNFLDSINSKIVRDDSDHNFTKLYLPQNIVKFDDNKKNQILISLKQLYFYCKKINKSTVKKLTLLKNNIIYDAAILFYGVSLHFNSDDKNIVSLFNLVKTYEDTKQIDKMYTDIFYLLFNDNYNFLQKNYQDRELNLAHKLFLELFSFEIDRLTKININKQQDLYFNINIKIGDNKTDVGQIYIGNQNNMINIMKETDEKKVNYVFTQKINYIDDFSKVNDEALFNQLCLFINKVIYNKYCYMPVFKNENKLFFFTSKTINTVRDKFFILLSQDISGVNVDNYVLNTDESILSFVCNMICEGFYDYLQDTYTDEDLKKHYTFYNFGLQFLTDNNKVIVKNYNFLEHYKDDDQILQKWLDLFNDSEEFTYIYKLCCNELENSIIVDGKLFSYENTIYDTEKLKNISSIDDFIFGYFNNKISDNFDSNDLKFVCHENVAKLKYFLTVLDIENKIITNVENKKDIVQTNYKLNEYEKIIMTGLYDDLDKNIYTGGDIKESDFINDKSGSIYRLESSNTIWDIFDIDLNFSSNFNFTNKNNIRKTLIFRTLEDMNHFILTCYIYKKILTFNNDQQDILLNILYDYDSFITNDSYKALFNDHNNKYSSINQNTISGIQDNINYIFYNKDYSLLTHIMHCLFSNYFIDIPKIFNNYINNFDFYFGEPIDKNNFQYIKQDDNTSNNLIDKIKSFCYNDPVNYTSSKEIILTPYIFRNKNIFDKLINYAEYNKYKYPIFITDVSNYKQQRYDRKINNMERIIDMNNKKNIQLIQSAINDILYNPSSNSDKPIRDLVIYSKKEYENINTNLETLLNKSFEYSAGNVILNVTSQYYFNNFKDLVDDDNVLFKTIIMQRYKLIDRYYIIAITEDDIKYKYTYDEILLPDTELCALGIRDSLFERCGIKLNDGKIINNPVIVNANEIEKANNEVNNYNIAMKSIINNFYNTIQKKYNNDKFYEFIKPFSVGFDNIFYNYFSNTTINFNKFLLTNSYIYENVAIKNIGEEIIYIGCKYFNLGYETVNPTSINDTDDVNGNIIYSDENNFFKLRLNDEYLSMFNEKILNTKNKLIDKKELKDNIKYLYRII